MRVFLLGSRSVLCRRDFLPFVWLGALFHIMHACTYRDASHYVCTPPSPPRKKTEGHRGPFPSHPIRPLLGALPTYTHHSTVSAVTVAYPTATVEPKVQRGKQSSLLPSKKDAPTTFFSLSPLAGIGYRTLSNRFATCARRTITYTDQSTAGET